MRQIMWNAKIQAILKFLIEYLEDTNRQKNMDNATWNSSLIADVGAPQ